MDEHRLQLLKDSKRTISKLQILSAFFQEDIIYKIYLRNQVIHQLFEKNEELDVNNLDLYHVQFTLTLIELLKKIKKNNEKKVLLLLDEIQLNKELIDKVNDTVFTEKNFKLEQGRQALKINNSLRKLFDVLSDHSVDYPFAKNINAFSKRYAQDYYYPIAQEEFDQLLIYDERDVYANAYATIHRKLMGILCKYDFRSTFVCGIKSGHRIAEIYVIGSADRQFLFYPERNLFLFCALETLDEVDLSNPVSRRKQFTQELINKNDELRSKVDGLKRYLPEEVKQLLIDNYKRISDINFLQQIGEIDIQANILRTMLNTDIL